MLAAIFVPRPREPLWRFLERVVKLPRIAGSRESGPLDTARMPVWRGLLELYDDPRIRYFTMTKPVRVGGTLFFGTGIVIAGVLRDPGPIGWLDPTAKTARSVSKREVTPILEACRELMKVAVVSKHTWTALEKFFLNCVFSMLGAGSINDLGGRQWRYVILNEQDRIPAKGGKDTPSPTNEAEARSSQFEDTRKIVRNCTPFNEGGLTWTEYLADSQHQPYVPCPECGGYQRLTMFREPAEPDKWMRVRDDDPLIADEGAEIPVLHPEDPRNAGLMRPADSHRPEGQMRKRAPDGRGWLVKGIPASGRLWWPESAKNKRSGRWDVDAAAAGARYECAHCGAHISYDQLDWMGRRYQLRSHNPHAPRDRASAGGIALLSPWRSWSSLVRDWLLAEGSIGKVSDFFSLKLGMPRPIPPTKVTPKHIEALQAKSPRYERQFPDVPDSELILPARPVIMTMSSDVNQDGCRYVIRAVLVDGTRQLLAWGIAGGFTDLDGIAQRVWKYDHGEGEHPGLRFEEFSPYTEIAGMPLATCIIDTGWKAKRALGVYQFIHDSGGKWIGVRGGAFGGLVREKPIAEETYTFNYPGRGEVDIPVIKVNDFHITEHLSRFVLKEHRTPLLHMPVTLDDTFVAEITAPYLTKQRLPDGRTEDVWRFELDPHFYDALKYGEALDFVFEVPVLQQLRARQDAVRDAIRVTLAGDRRS